MLLKILYLNLILFAIIFVSCGKKDNIEANKNDVKKTKPDSIPPSPCSPIIQKFETLFGKDTVWAVDRPSQATDSLFRALVINNCKFSYRKFNWRQDGADWQEPFTEFDYNEINGCRDSTASFKLIELKNGTILKLHFQTGQTDPVRIKFNQEQRTKLKNMESV